MEDNGALSPSMLVPLRSDHYHVDNYAAHHQLEVVLPPTTAITSTTPTTSRFTLPKGWRVKKVPRSDGSRVDTYYYEPETRCQFRSLKEVQRYMNGELYTPRRRACNNSDYRNMSISNGKNSNSRKMIVSGGKMLRLDDEEFNNHQLAIVPHMKTITSPFNLPEGWVVEEVPRRSGGSADKYYYEPGTSRKFRSLIAVERYLTELNENIPLSQMLAEYEENAPLSKAFKLENRIKKNTPTEKMPSSTFTSPPMKINWVLASSGGDRWNPFIGEMLVPESVKQQWAERFTRYLNNRNDDAPNSG